MNPPNLPQRVVSPHGQSGRKVWDLLAAAVLFLATAAVILWQNVHLAVLWDLSYTLDSSVRIALGQIPYRDFPFAHAPLTFLIQAAIIRLTGRVFFHHVLYAAIVGGLGTVLAWRITLHSLRNRMPKPGTRSLLLVSPLTVLGIYSILPFPSYDCDCIFAVLLVLFLLQRLDSSSVGISSNKSRLGAFLTGAAAVLPVFFKQNIGIPFLLVLILAMLGLLLISLMRRSSDAFLGAAVLAGIVTSLAVAALLLHATVGLRNYFHWTIQFAAQRRLPGLITMLGVYQQPSLLWMLPCVAITLVILQTRWAKSRLAQSLALALLSAPFLWTLYSLVLFDDADERGDSLLALWPFLLVLSAVLTLWNLYRQPTLRSLLPVMVLAAIHGTLLSQQLWGSTHALWPLLIFLLAEMIVFLSGLERMNQAAILALCVVITATLLLCGGFYTASEERLSYAQLPDGPVQHSALPQLRGMAVTGPYLTNFEELLRYADAHIPFSDGIVLLPGEDPFYFATSRIPQFPVLLFDPATDPYTPAQLVEQVHARNARWLIVKRELQLKEDPTPQREATMQALLQEFTLETHLQGYDVYRRSF